MGSVDHKVRYLKIYRACVTTKGVALQERAQNERTRSGYKIRAYKKLLSKNRIAIQMMKS